MKRAKFRLGTAVTVLAVTAGHTGCADDPAAPIDPGVNTGDEAAGYEDSMTPKERREWVEVVSGLGEQDPIFETINSSLYEGMRRDDVVELVQPIVKEAPISRDGDLWIGEYQFTFDDQGFLAGIGHGRSESGVQVKATRRAYE